MAMGSCKILLVEDLEINRKLMRTMLMKLGLGFDEAENGEVAVEYFSEGRKYDLVLMDKDMPTMDGHEATRRLRSQGVTTPIVALTADGSDANVDQFLAAGANGFYTKPLTMEKLLQILAEFGLLDKQPDES